jgi:hypothetical protein
MAGVVGGLTSTAAQVPMDFERDYFKSELTKYEVEISGTDFDIFDVFQQNYPDGENEQVRIESDDATVQISFFDDPDSPEDTIELWVSGLSDSMDSLEVVESGEDDDRVWYYAEGEYEDTAFVYYIQITEDVVDNVDILESVLTEGSLIDTVGAAQQDITINGEGFMDNVDLDELEQLTGGDSSLDDEEPDATAEAGT